MFLRTISPFYAPSRQSVIFPIHAFRINIQAAKTHLSRLVEEVASGQDIVLAKAGKPLVRLVPYVQTQGERLGGQFRGEIWQADDCWDDSSSLLDESISSGLFHQITEPALAAEEASRA